ncbi:hypothetical protein DNU42_22680 [Salmonella enterica subsp. enterica serovar Newport]|nr:hypothetical protein [Salmonella enterica subsp. enterica serovar Newport]
MYIEHPYIILSIILIIIAFMYNRIRDGKAELYAIHNKFKESQSNVERLEYRHDNAIQSARNECNDLENINKELQEQVEELQQSLDTLQESIDNHDCQAEVDEDAHKQLMKSYEMFFKVSNENEYNDIDNSVEMNNLYAQLAYLRENVLNHIIDESVKSDIFGGMYLAGAKERKRTLEFYKDIYSNSDNEKVIDLFARLEEDAKSDIDTWERDENSPPTESFEAYIQRLNSLTQEDKNDYQDEERANYFVRRYFYAIKTGELMTAHAYEQAKNSIIQPVLIFLTIKSALESLNIKDENNLKILDGIRKILISSIKTSAESAIKFGDDSMNHEDTSNDIDAQMDEFGVQLDNKDKLSIENRTENLHGLRKGNHEAMMEAFGEVKK